MEQEQGDSNVDNSWGGKCVYLAVHTLTVGLKQVLQYSDLGRCQRVPGVSGLPGYLVFTLIGLPVITMDVTYAAK